MSAENRSVEGESSDTLADLESESDDEGGTNMCTVVARVKKFDFRSAGRECSVVNTAPSEESAAAPPATSDFFVTAGSISCKMDVSAAATEAQCGLLAGVPKIVDDGMFFGNVAGLGLEVAAAADDDVDD